MVQVQEEERKREILHKSISFFMHDWDDNLIE